MRQLNLLARLQAICFGLVLSFPSLTAALTVTEGPLVITGPTTATIVWKTDVAAGTRVHYGLRENLLDKRLSGGVGIEHRVNLTELAPDTTYHFSIGSSRSVLAHGSFVTKSQVDVVGSGKSAFGITLSRWLSALVPSLEKEKTAVASAAAVGSTSTASVRTPLPHQTWRNLETLMDHYERHGADFKSLSANHYATQSWLFLQRARQLALPMKWDDADNTLRVWEPKTLTFGAFDDRGKTRTFFKASNPSYWARQPGKSTLPSELPFE